MSRMHSDLHVVISDALGLALSSLPLREYTLEPIISLVFQIARGTIERLSLKYHRLHR